MASRDAQAVDLEPCVRLIQHLLGLVLGLIRSAATTSSARAAAAALPTLLVGFPYRPVCRRAKRRRACRCVRAVPLPPTGDQPTVDAAVQALREVVEPRERPLTPGPFGGTVSSPSPWTEVLWSCELDVEAPVDGPDAATRIVASKVDAEPYGLVTRTACDGGRKLDRDSTSLPADTQPHAR